MEKINVETLRFTKCKGRGYNLQTNYSISGINGSIKIKMNNVYVPFGYESYNGKYILNFEINPEKNNYHYNLYAYLKAFEDEMKDINKIRIDDISGKEYFASIKESKAGYMMRAYISGNTEIYGYNKGEKILLTSDNIKNFFCNIELELGSLWINKNMYGVLWYVKKIEVLL